MDKAAFKNAAFIAAIAWVVFEGIATLVQLIDPQGGLLHVNYRNPVQHIIIVVAALGFEVTATCFLLSFGGQHPHFTGTLCNTKFHFGLLNRI